MHVGTPGNKLLVIAASQTRAEVKERQPGLG